MVIRRHLIIREIESDKALADTNPSAPRGCCGARQGVRAFGRCRLLDGRSLRGDVFAGG